MYTRLAFDLSSSTDGVVSSGSGAAAVDEKRTADAARTEDADAGTRRDRRSSDMTGEVELER